MIQSYNSPVFAEDHIAHKTTVDKISYVTNNRNEGRHYIPLSTQQDLTVLSIQS
jgi:hypothetical protein